MSKPSDGIVLAPMKGSELIRLHKENEATEPVSRYVAPSKRGEEAKVVRPLTSEQLDSTTNFPSLPSTKPMTKNISWGELRSRLTPSSEISMKSMVEQAIKNEELAQEEAQKEQAITDPFLMKPEQRSREGWEMLKLSRASWFCRNYATEILEQPYSWPAPIMNFHVDKTQKLIHTRENILS